MMDFSWMICKRKRYEAIRNINDSVKDVRVFSIQLSIVMCLHAASRMRIDIDTSFFMKGRSKW